MAEFASRGKDDLHPWRKSMRWKDMAMIYLHSAMESLLGRKAKRYTLLREGDELRLMLLGLKRFTKIEPFNLKEAAAV